MKRLYFGTDGVRGPFGGPVVNIDFARRLGWAAARWAAEARLRVDGSVDGRADNVTSGASRAPADAEVLIARDTRASGPALSAAIAAGLREGGLHPLDLGVLPTPALARAVAKRGARLGVVITASHNPASDNGIKFFAPGGLKLTDAEEAAIESFLPATATAAATARSSVEPASASGAGDVTDPTGEAARRDYIDSLSGRLPAGALVGWRIVVDSANGATFATTPAALRQLGADVTVLGGEPDGQNINAGVGSEHPDGLARATVAAGARLGVAHDGDGDRCVLCDESGFVLDGDEILAILALDALHHGTLDAGALVVTVQSNLGLDAAIHAAGGRVERTDVGDRHVLARMRALGARLGGESSGHLIDLHASPTGDGLAAAVGVIAIMHATGRPLSALRGQLRKFPQATRNLRIAAKRPLADCAALVSELAALEQELAGQGRVMARFSGTEPKLRLLAEGRDDTVVAAALARLENAARRDLIVS